VAKAENVSYVDDASEALARMKSGASPYFAGDDLHFNASGQPILAHTLQRAAELALRPE
jgi:lysophospholipase L1-like esterase